MKDGEIHVYSPSVTKYEVAERNCPVCGCYSRILIECWDWYSPQATCLMCGDAWSDGELLERPFCPGWREERIEKAKKRLARYEK